MVAINIQPQFSLGEWTSFWRSKGAREVVLAQDKQAATIRAYRLLALGTEVIVDREGRFAFRSDGPAGPQTLRAAIESALRR